MDKFSPKLIISVFVFLLILGHLHVNAVVADNEYGCTTERSMKLIEAWQHKFMASKNSHRKLRVASSHPPPMINLAPHFKSPPPRPPPPPQMNPPYKSPPPPII